MAARRSPFYGENLNLILLRRKIEALDYTPLPTNFYSMEVRLFCMFTEMLIDVFSFVFWWPNVW
jgi:hypothetical protein